MHIIRKKQLEIYVTENGRIPFTDWLESLKDKTARFRIKERLDRVSLGNLGDYKSIGEGVYELRLTFGPGYRIYFGQEGEKIILLLCGGDKSTQIKDIKKAKEYWQAYLLR
jgi:putative addiction module killer protein